MSQLQRSSCTDLCCFFCGEVGNVNVSYEMLALIMCKYCVVAGSLKAEEIIIAGGTWDYNLIFMVGDDSVLVKEHLDGAVEFASAGLEGMEYFEGLKELIFEVTQSISD